MLFTVAGPSTAVTSTIYNGIADHGGSRTLWVTREEPDRSSYAEQWSLDGHRLSTIELQPHATGIAADPADGTLWVVRDEVNVSRIFFDNVGPSGRALGTFAIERPVGIGVVGMEFAWPANE